MTEATTRRTPRPSMEQLLGMTDDQIREIVRTIHAEHGINLDQMVEADGLEPAQTCDQVLEQWQGYLDGMQGNTDAHRALASAADTLFSFLE